MSYATALRCRKCAREYSLEGLNLCDFCFSPLEVSYDYKSIAKAVSREKIIEGPPNMWRYKDLLPVKLLAQTEGIFAEAVGGVVVAALKKLAASGVIERNELSVAVVTGAGPRTQEIIAQGVHPLVIQPTLESLEEVFGK